MMMGLVIEVKVIPGSKKQSFELDKQGTIKCLLKSQPEKGKANEELIKLLSKSLGTTQDALKIITGQTGRKKLVKINIDNLTLATFYLLCGIKAPEDKEPRSTR